MKQTADGDRSYDFLYKANWNEPQHDKTNNMKWASCENKDHPGHPLSARRKLAFKAQSEDSDQTGRMSRLIWVFGGRTDHFVGFVLLLLIGFFCNKRAEIFIWWLYAMCCGNENKDKYTDNARCKIRLLHLQTPQQQKKVRFKKISHLFFSD